MKKMAKRNGASSSGDLHLQIQHLGDGPRSTPTIDGNFLCALSGTGELVCVDIANKGKEVWRKNLEKDFGGAMMTEWATANPARGRRSADLHAGRPERHAGPRSKRKPASSSGKARLDAESALFVGRRRRNSGRAPVHPDRLYRRPKGGNVSGVEAKTGKLLCRGNFSPATVITSRRRRSCWAIKSSPRRERRHRRCQLFDIDAKQNAIEKYDTLKKKKKVKNNHGGVVLIDGCIYGIPIRKRGFAWT